MAWTVLRTVTDSVSYVTAADHNETKANFDILGGTDGATKTGNWYVTGNVGIGTSGPAYKLDVAGDIRLSNNLAIYFNDSAGTARRTVHLASTNYWYIGDVDNITGSRLFLRGKDYVHIDVNTVTRMSVDSSGAVGIGTTTPGALLDVYGGNIRADAGGTNNIVLRDGAIENHKVASDTGGITVNYAGYNSGTTYYRDFAICSGKYNVIAFFQGSTGRLGLGTSSPGYLLTLASDSAAKPTSNTWTISSDARVKEVIGSYTRGVADIMALEPKRYRLNGAFGSVDDGRVHVSVVAQEAQATWPEMVGTYEHTDKDEDDVETVTELLNLNTNELQWALVNAIKELAQRLEALEA